VVKANVVDQRMHVYNTGDVKAADQLSRATAKPDSGLSV